MHLVDLIEQRKAVLREVRAALAAAQANQGVVPPATITLIPKPRGTSGRGNFNLANEMGINKKLCNQIQVRLPFHPSTYLLTAHTGLCPFTCEHVNT
jgi:hypothetical protein